MPTAPLYDAHNHLHDAWLAPHHDALAAQLPALGLRRAVVNGTSETDWSDVAAFAKKFPAFVHPSYGLHPWDTGNRTPAWLDHLRRQLDSDPHAALGEIGLDRWILDRARSDDPRLAGLRRAPLDEQAECFLAQLALAAERNLPASIHCIDAYAHLEQTLRAAPRLPARGFLLHAYAGSVELIKTFADLGAYFSFNGNFLHATANPDPYVSPAGETTRQPLVDIKNPKSRRLELYQHVPADRILVETDAPAMPLPQAWRTHKLPPTEDGTPANHPGNIEAAYFALAALRGIELPTLAAQIEQNFLRLFGPSPHAR